MSALLEVEDLRMHFFTKAGVVKAVDGVSFTIPSGCVFALLGGNGAGKSTIHKVASGRLAPTSGCVHVAGVHVNGADPDQLARAGVCTIPEGRGVFPNLTVSENLKMMTYRGGVRLRDVEERAFGRFPRLRERRKQLAGTMSGGEQQMLAMARALVTEPSLLLLDEISIGLAPIIVGQLYEIVRQLRAEGLSILLVEQFAQTALAVADYAAVMAHGQIMRVVEPQDIAEEVSAANLGGAA